MEWWKIALFIYGALVLLMFVFSVILYHINKNKPFVYRNDYEVKE